MNSKSIAIGLVAIIVAGSAAHASSNAAYATLDKRSAAACIRASGFQNGKAGPSVRFSDATMIDARLVTGTYPQAHMKGAKGTMLCLYNRKTRRAETQEAPAPIAESGPPAPGCAIKDVWWRAEDIGGRGVVASADVKLMFGSDGKIGGKSGCNNYAVNYALTGTKLKVYPPMIGTRMMCPADVMAQEALFEKMLGEATGAAVLPNGKMLVTGPSGAMRFVPGSNAPITILDGTSPN